jgi:hypothetical protein
MRRTEVRVLVDVVDRGTYDTIYPDEIRAL